MGLYFGVSLFAFGGYAALLLADPTTSNCDRASWTVATIAALAWPIVLPISFFGELLPRWRKSQQTKAFINHPQTTSLQSPSVQLTYAVYTQPSYPSVLQSACPSTGHIARHTIAPIETHNASAGS
jgi:hypothetical protein